MDRKEAVDLDKAFKEVAERNYQRMLDDAEKKANNVFNGVLTGGKNVATQGLGLDDFIVNAKQDIINNAEEAKTDRTTLITSILETRINHTILRADQDPFFCSQYVAGGDLEQHLKSSQSYLAIHDVCKKHDAQVELNMTARGLELEINLNKGYDNSSDKGFVKDVREGTFVRKGMFPGATNL